MSAQHLLELAPEFSARVLRDVPMARHTSWHAGGAAGRLRNQPSSAARLMGVVSSHGGARPDVG